MMVGLSWIHLGSGFCQFGVRCERRLLWAKISLQRCTSIDSSKRSGILSCGLRQPKMDVYILDVSTSQCISSI